MVNANPRVGYSAVRDSRDFCPATRANISSGSYVYEMRAEPGKGGRFSWLIALTLPTALPMVAMGLLP